ncbi:leucine-rich repeat domain-containing protein [Glutamicibacter creatinolyticus]|uniref:leucine-rich repeat domain-containing protein n=1 Tax=Glutamicibacter creatinolyticus TaxID=162496 RepID=UPI00321657A8
MGKETSYLRLTIEEDAMQVQELSVPGTAHSLAGLEKAANLEILEAQPSADLDLSPISSLKKLTDLDLSYSEVKDLSTLKDWPLEMLVLSDTAVEDISALEGMPLQLLNLSNTPVTDLSPLSRMESLEELYLDGSAVTDLSSLAKTPIRTLFADDLKVKDWKLVEHACTVLN